MDYKELREKADSIKESQNARAKENYHYARGLGFTSVESMLLQYKSKEEIDRIAKERDGQVADAS
jgi:rhamnogalacturonyl hydrolase YesR